MRQLKKTSPPVSDEKKRKGTKEKLSTKKISKENTDPTVVKEKTEMHGAEDGRHWDIYQELLKFRLTEKELQMNNYPADHNYKPPNVVQADCGSRSCVRCKENFEVFNGVYFSPTKCKYHPKKAFARSYLRKHPCCGKKVGEEGCTEFNYHVTIQHEPRPLLKTTPRRHARSNLRHRILSLDCEMSYTTAGLEVTRIGVVDIDGRTVYDTYVKPANYVLDYNTQYSGVEKRHLEHLTTTLEDVKNMLNNNFLDEDTILIGHALNNDLAALGLIHKTIVDTSVLYADEKTPWMKTSLKSLALEFLRISIQNDPSGHNCIDDARACLRLALLKVGANSPCLSRPTENYFTEQTLTEIQNFNYPPMTLAYDMFKQHQGFKKCYNNLQIGYFSTYPVQIV